ncbi:Protein F41C3.5, partial [Aphelenchoides avenae]
YDLEIYLFCTLDTNPFDSSRPCEMDYDAQVFVCPPPGAVRYALPCVNDTDLMAYLNRKDVRKAIHIPKNFRSYDSFGGDTVEPFMEHTDNFTRVFRELIGSRLRVMFYNGDLDLWGNYLNAKYFVEKTGLK